MSKLVKRIRKYFKNPRNVLIIGTGFGFLNELCDHFDSIFIISTLEEPIRRKNLIYRQSFEGIEFVPDIDVIFIDRNQNLNVENLRPVITRYHPVIFVEGDELFEKAQYKFLKNYGFSVVERRGYYHIWNFEK
jgi:hypothetical protein